MVAPLQMHYLSKNIYDNILKPYKETFEKDILEKDYGKKETFEKWNGKFLDDSTKVYKVTKRRFRNNETIVVIRWF